MTESLPAYVRRITAKPETVAAATEFYDRPCAAAGLNSYRYRGRYGWIMIGATSPLDALSEAARSTSDAIVNDNLQKWDGNAYVPVTAADF